MIIKSISLKNFKSFGNNTQTLEFDTDTGNLILISGKNGNGKTSLQQSFDFSLFGIVRGKNGKRATQSILPNRVNKNLETEINFINNLSDNIRIQRNLAPNKAKIFINDSDESKKFKTYKKEERDKIIGFDFETYKSFISMSVSDFANFIDLTPDEKRRIINKLFNLQDLDDYLSLSNSLIKNYKEEKIKYNAILDTNTLTINTLKENIEKIKNSNVIDRKSEIEKLNKLKNSKKEPFLNLKNKEKEYSLKISNIEKKRLDIENQKNIIHNDILEIKIEIKNLNEKLKVYKSGVCPTCSTILKDNTKHEHNLSNILEEKNKLDNKYRELNDKKDNLTLYITKIYNQKQTYQNQRNDNTTKYNNLVYDLKNITKKITTLKIEEKHDSTEELEKNISELEINNIENNNKISELNNKISIQEELKGIFSNHGVRKSIIKNIVKPINVYLCDILNDLKSTYSIKIDEEFNVNIFERMIIEVHPESLSMGESKKINIAIALSYLKLILKMRNLNILFLDEVFSSMEPDNVNYAMNILKKFTKEFNINIIILDPKVYFTENNNFGSEYFDRIIKIEKYLTFSTIVE